MDEEEGGRIEVWTQKKSACGVKKGKRGRNLQVQASGGEAARGWTLSGWRMSVALWWSCRTLSSFPVVPSYR